MSNIQEQEGKELIPLRRYSIKELSALYHVHKSTFLGWLKPFQKDIGQRDGHFYTIAQVKIIFQKLDTPSLSEEKDNSSEGDTKMAA